MNQDIFPVGTYSYLIALVIVFLVTDLLRYKPVIILDGLFAVATWSLLIWGKNVLAMQVILLQFIIVKFLLYMQVAYGLDGLGLIPGNSEVRIFLHTLCPD